MNLESVKKYQRTKKGWITKSYATMRRSSFDRGHPLPNFTKIEFKEFVYWHGYHPRIKKCKIVDVCIGCKDRVIK